MTTPNDPSAEPPQDPPPPGQWPPPSYPSGPSQGPPPGYPPAPGGPPPGYPPAPGGPPPGYGTPPAYGAPPAYGSYPAAPSYDAPPNQYGYGGAAPVPGGRLAGMGARFGGLVLDTIIVAIPVVVIAAAAGLFKTKTTCGSSGTCSKSFDLSANLLLDLIALVIGMAYAAYFIGMRGQTPGHRAAGIKVVDANTGAMIGPGRAALRWFVMTITGAICTLGYWSPFFDSQRRQGWHDKSAKAVVVPAR